MPKPLNDGKTHLNIYSKGKTELGRFLSNFAYCPIETIDGPFASIEGYWYWLSCRDERLRIAYGFAAKYTGRQLGGNDWMDDEDFKMRICAAIAAKLETPTAKDLLTKNKELLKLPFVHYYSYGNKVVTPKDGKWIIDFIETYIKEHYL